MFNQVALISQTDSVSFHELALASAALQKQVTRDLAPIWGLHATVDPFETLDDVPLGYWPVVIRDDIPFPAAGIHLNEDNGQPFALVRFSDDWTLTTSHETLEMLVDPSGNRTIGTNSPHPEQGRVLILVEVCDPSEAGEFGYSVNGVAVSDFYTPRFFDPVTSVGVQYSFTGALRKPREVRDGGYLSWWDPESRHVFQVFVNGNEQEFVDRGPVPQGFTSLRTFTDQFTNSRREKVLKLNPPKMMLTGALAGRGKAKPTKVDASTKAVAESLRAQITRVITAKYQ